MTEHITDIEAMIEKLIGDGYAYKEGGSVYFRVSSFQGYGKLANLKFDEMKEGENERASLSLSLHMNRVGGILMWITLSYE